MELKEAILQTLAEMDANTIQKEIKQIDQNYNERDALLEVIPQELSTQNPPKSNPYERKIEKLELKSADELKALLATYYKEEEKFLEALQERILVLFEGIQSPNNRNIETKVEMILNFLEYTLAIIDEKKNNK